MNAEQIIAQTKNIVITVDHKGYFKSINPAFHKILGYTKEEVLNKKFETFVHPDDIEKTNEQFNKLVQGKESQNFENRYVHKNGEMVHILWNSFPLDSKEGLICGIGNIVTNLKKAESSTLQAKQLLEISQSIAYVGGWELDLITKENLWTEQTYRIHDTSREEFNPTVDAGIDFYLPESQEILKKALQAAIEKGEDYDLELELRTVKGRLIHVRTNCTVIFHEGKAVRLVGAIQDITDRKTYEKKIEESESKLRAIFDNSLNSILVADDLGNYIFANKAATEMFGYREEELLKMNVGQLRTSIPDNATDLYNKYLEKGQEVGEFGFVRPNGEERIAQYHAVRVKADFNLSVLSDVTKNKITEQKLRESEAKYRSFFENAGLGIGYYSPEGIILSFNSIAAKAMNGVPKDFKGKSVIDIFPKDTAYLILNRFQELLKTDEIGSFEDLVALPSGDQWFLSTYCKITDSKQGTQGIQIISQNITEKKLTEIALSESEVNTNAILNSMTSSICVIDKTGNIIHTNEIWNEFSLSGGYKGIAESFNDYNYFDVCKADIQDEHAKSVYDGLQNLLKGKIDEFELIYPCHAPNKQQWFLLRANLMKTKEKQIVIAHIDISDRKRLENEQKRLIEQSDLAIKTAQLGIWTLDIASGSLSWNDQQLTIYGLSRSEFENDLDGWRKQLHPEDVEFANKELSKIFDGESVFGIEFRIIRKDGEIRYIDASGTPFYNDSKELVQVIGINRDITEQKIAEQKLKISEEKFFNAFENAPYPTSILNLKTGERMAVNHAYCEISGYSKSELLDGAIPLNSLAIDKTQFNKLKNIILENGFSNQEPLTIRTKSGEIRMLLVTCNKLYPNDDDLYITTINDVTEERKYEERLKQSDRVFNLAIDMFCIAGYDGYFKYLNPAWEKILGWSTEELLANPWVDFVHPEDKNKTEDIKSEIVDGKEILHFENRYISKDGSVKWLSWKSQPFPEEGIMVGAARDITTEKEQELKLLQSASNLQRAQQIAHLGSWYLDVKTNVVTWTEELYKMYGLDPAKPAPMWSEQQNFYTKQSWEVLCSAVEKASKDGVPYELELNIIRKDQSMGWIMSRGEALKDDSGYIYALSGIAQDITSKKENLLQLEKAKMKAEEADKSKSVFLANMSHEIRTPLNAIIGFSRLLTDDLTASDKKMYLDQVHSNSKHLLTLVDDILNISKIESEQIKIINKPVRLHQLVQEIFDYHVNHIKNHDKENVVLELNLPKNAIENDFIELDPVRLKEILHNLICNAIKFTAKGTIQIGYSYKPKEVEFFVRDEGIGISETHQKNIFERFAQAPNISENYGGTGLGLAICKGLIEKMGGQIWVESKLNVGSTFFFTLPKISTDSWMKKSGKQVSNDFSVKTGGKVLIADDSPSVQLYYKSIMKKHQVDAIIVRSGQEALDCYNQNMNSIELVLMDIRMPGMDGIETMKRLKKINSEIKVIAQTAFAMKSELERFRELGFDGCITKPIAEEELIKLIKS